MKSMQKQKKKKHVSLESIMHISTVHDLH